MTDAASTIARAPAAGQLVVLESTTYPGTTREVLLADPRNRRAAGGQGLPPGHVSPERIDPGRTDYDLRTIPKVVGGLTPAAPSGRWRSTRACVEHVVPVSLAATPPS